MMTSVHTEVDFRPRPDLPPLRMTVVGDRVTPSPLPVAAAPTGASARSSEPACGEGYAEEFAAWCHEAALVLADRHARRGAERTVANLRTRFESWYGVDFAKRKLQRLSVQVQAEVMVVLRPFIERTMLIHYGAIIDQALAESLEDPADEGAA